MIDFKLIPPVKKYEVLTFVLLLVHVEGFLHESHCPLAYASFSCNKLHENKQFFFSSTPMIFAVFAGPLPVGQNIFIVVRHDVLKIDVSFFVNSIAGVIQPRANLRLKTILLLQIS